MTVTARLVVASRTQAFGFRSGEGVVLRKGIVAGGTSVATCPTDDGALRAGSPELSVCCRAADIGGDKPAAEASS